MIFRDRSLIPLDNFTWHLDKSSFSFSAMPSRRRSDNISRCWSCSWAKKSARSSTRDLTCTWSSFCRLRDSLLEFVNRSIWMFNCTRWNIKIYRFSDFGSSVTNRPTSLEAGNSPLESSVQLQPVQHLSSSFPFDVFRFVHEIVVTPANRMNWNLMLRHLSLKRLASLCSLFLFHYWHLKISAIVDFPPANCWPMWLDPLFRRAIALQSVRVPSGLWKEEAWIKYVPRAEIKFYFLSISYVLL